jgi:hypothetical protein
MMGDPLIISTMQVDNATMYAFEMCDAPEDDQFGYEINGVLVSDWIYTSWFATEKAGPYDYKGHIQKPLQILPGGYIGALKLAASDGWTQIFGQEAPRAHHAGGHGSRFDRRTRRYGWRRSAA